LFYPEEDAVVFGRIAKNSDWLNVLKSCPVKMDNLPPRRRSDICLVATCHDVIWTATELELEQIHEILECSASGDAMYT
jgi:hypothetical protein